MPQRRSLRARLGGWWLRRLRRIAVELMQDFKPDQQKKEKAAMRLLRWLLRIMSVIFVFRGKFRRDNLGKDFAATIVFKTRTETSACSVVFRKHRWFRLCRMGVEGRSVQNADVVLTFRNGVNLFDYILFTEDHDPVNLLLENQVKMEGNLNVVYKFMYMVRYLIRPLGLT
jgi:hypothetical protein